MCVCADQVFLYQRLCEFFHLETKSDLNSPGNHLIYTRTYLITEMEKDQKDN